MPEVQGKEVSLIIRIELVIVALSAIASASAIYDNLGAPTVFFDGVCEFPGESAACFGPLADSFSTSGSVTVTRVTVLLKGDAPGGSGETTVELLSDERGRPGAEVLQLGIIKDTELSSAYKEFSFAETLRLQGGTRYWVELFDTSGEGLETTADWGHCLAACQGDLGVPGEFFANGGDEPGGGFRVFPNRFGPYQMEVEATVNPEPASGLLVGSGLGLSCIVYKLSRGGQGSARARGRRA